jgi:hypothetical protein
MLTLSQASAIVDHALAYARAHDLAPMTIAALDARGCIVALKMEDGSGLMRPDIAAGKAWGALGMGWPCVPQSRQRPLPICTKPCSRGAHSFALSNWRLRRKRPASASRQFSAARTAYFWCARMAMSLSPAVSLHRLGSLMRIAACG